MATIAKQKFWAEHCIGMFSIFTLQNFTFVGTQCNIRRQCMKHNLLLYYGLLFLSLFVMKQSQYW